MVGFSVTDKFIDEIQKEDRYLSVQTHKLSWAVINGLEANAGVIVDLLSTLPISTFPNGRKIIAEYYRWDRGNGSSNVSIPFVNFIGIKHLTRFIGCLYFTYKWAIKTRSVKNRIILLYGLNSALAYAVLFVSGLFNIKVTAIVTDPPSVDLPGEIWLTKMLRRIDRFLIINAMRSMDGLIVLVKSLAKTFSPEVPYIVMEGIVLQDDINKYTDLALAGVNSAVKRKFIIMYAGGLAENYGIKSLLSAFETLDEDDYQLWIFGSGPLETFIRESVNKDPRIVFWGVVSNNEILERLSQATVLINPRPTNLEFTIYSFPSKTIEYMASGRPILSTRLKGIPSEYFQYLIPIDRETPEGIAAAIRMVKVKPSDELDKIGAEGRNFVIKYKNELIQGKKILAFLFSIIAETKGNVQE